jgi:hypothetical protein
MRSLSGFYKRTLPERTLDIYREVEEPLQEIADERWPGAKLRIRAYDDRQRFLEETRRQAQSAAAALAQRHLAIANELMRLTGNSAWNSPAGTAEVLDEGMEAIQRETGEVMRAGGELAALCTDYRRLIAEGVEDNLARRQAAPR